MKFSVIKVDRDNNVIENFGILEIAEVKALALHFIPEVFASKTEVSNAIKVIKAEGCDDWFVAGPAVINIRRVEE